MLIYMNLESVLKVLYLHNQLVSKLFRYTPLSLAQ